MSKRSSVNKVITIDFEPVDWRPFPTVGGHHKEKQTQKVKSLVTKLTTKSNAEKLGSEVEIALMDMIRAALEKHRTPLMVSTVFMRMRLHPEVRELIDRSLQPSNIELNRLRHLVATTIGGMLSHKRQRKYKLLISEAASLFYSTPAHHHVRLGCFAKGIKDLASEGLFPNIKFVARMSEKTIKKYASEHATDIAQSRGRNGANELQLVRDFLKRHFTAKNKN
ncbi:hypothetical protein ACHELO_003331 [Vibrio fluvialis]